MTKIGTAELIARAWSQGIVLPAFNIPYLPMLGAVVAALRESACVGLIAVARPDWEKFGAGSLKDVREEYERHKDERYTRLHLDHVPVVDEDGLTVDYMGIIREAIELGYESVMVDASRLPLEENIAATRRVVKMAHKAGIPVEGELGAVLGHESGPLPPYDELFASGKGFTDPQEAARFVRESGVDWLSVAIGNIHGAISGARRNEPKLRARLNIDHLKRIADATRVPLVLHGGSGIQKQYILEAMRNGIAKINIGTAIRQAYEQGAKASVAAGREATYLAALHVIREELEVAGSAAVLHPEGHPEENR